MTTARPPTRKLWTPGRAPPRPRPSHRVTRAGATALPRWPWLTELFQVRTVGGRVVRTPAGRPASDCQPPNDFSCIQCPGSTPGTLTVSFADIVPCWQYALGACIDLSGSGGAQSARLNTFNPNQTFTLDYCGGSSCLWLGVFTNLVNYEFWRGPNESCSSCGCETDLSNANFPQTHDTFDRNWIAVQYGNDHDGDGNPIFAVSISTVLNHATPLDDFATNCSLGSGGVGLFDGRFAWDCSATATCANLRVAYADSNSCNSQPTSPDGYGGTCIIVPG